LLKDCTHEFFLGRLFEIARTVFGIVPEQLTDQPDFILAVFNAICERYAGITVSDIENVFRSHEPSEKVYVLSRKDILDPIEKYWNVKMIIMRELKWIHERAKEDLEIERKRADFRCQAEEKYRQSLIEGKWIGDEFDANAIARDYASYFRQPEKDEMWKKAKREFRERSAAIKEDAFALPVPADVKIYSRIIIETCINRQLALIIE
jgi:hypothetical protein